MAPRLNGTTIKMIRTGGFLREEVMAFMLLDKVERVHGVHVDTQGMSKRTAIMQKGVCKYGTGRAIALK